MKIKEIIIICLIMCFIFSISSVSAVDVDADDTNNTVLTTADVDVVKQSNDLSTISLPENTTLLGDGERSFSELSGHLNGDYTLDKDYKYSSSDTAYISGITIDKSITIDGDGHSIDGDNQARIFNIAEGASVTLKNIKLINGKTTDNGGAIYSQGTISLENCTFINNNAKDGGAIYLQNLPGLLTKLNFTDNHATNDGGALYYHPDATVSDEDGMTNSVFTGNTAGDEGGALFLYGNNGNMRNVNFTSNIAANDGGAIMIIGANWGVYDSTFKNNNATTRRGGAIYLENSKGSTVSNSKFYNNTAGTNGGAIDWHNGAENGKVINTIFINNTAKRSGGAIYWYGHNGTILSSNFTNNTALGLTYAVNPDGENITGGDGGAVLWTGDLGTVDDCIFKFNTADKRGGAIFLRGTGEATCKDTSFTNSKFINNTAGTNGGAIDWNKGAQNGIIDAVEFIDNTALRSGGAVFWYGYNGTIRNSNFTHNYALGVNNATSVMGDVTYGGDGGAIIWTGSLCIVDNCNFNDNEAAKRGGAVFLQGTSEDNCTNTTFKNSNFTSNVAGTNGGAIDWNKGAHNGIIDKTEFINNTAKRSGGAIFWNGHNGTISWAKFYNNRALGINNATSVMGDVTYGGDGGAVIWSGALGTVFYSNFVNNTAAKRGGAVFLQGTTDEDCDNTTFKNSYFADNIAGTNGGAIDWFAGAHHGIVDNVTFINNTAKRSGGAIFWHGNDGVVKNSIFTNNRATGEYLQYDMDVTYDNFIVVNKNETEFLKVDPTESDKNKVYALNYTDASNQTIRIFKSYVADDRDGTLKWLMLDETTVTETTISPKDWALDQFFGGDGGTILWSGDIGRVYNCIFIESNSARRGGGAYMTGSDYVTYDHCQFINCTSGTNGGGVDWLAGANYGKIYNCVFNNTRAARSAGAIYYDGWYGEMINITVIGTQSYGGSLKTSRDERVQYAGWDSSHWDTNTTGGDAGAIMYTGSHIYVYNATFTDCVSVGRGGAVFLQDNSNVTFESCRFINNEAKGVANNTWANYTQERDESQEDTQVNDKLTGHGGAIAFDIGAHDTTIKDSVFDYNYARRDGGAINIAENSYNFTIENCIFNHDSTGDDGGAINWEGDLGLVKNITCYNCTGKAFDDEETGSSTSKGGTICVTGDNITITESSFTLGTVYHNKGKLNETDAGAIFITGENTTVSHSLFDRCSSPNHAGAIKVIGNLTLIDNCTFVSCTAVEDGGALYVEGMDCKLYNSTFRFNIAGDDGGAILWSGPRGIIYNSTFSINNAVGMGGSHSLGGSINLVGNYTSVEKSKFEMSSATVAGGAIYATGNYVNITDSTFSRCNVTMIDEAKYAHGGGAIFIEGTNAFVSNCTMNQTHAQYGGVIYIQGNNATVDNSTAKMTYAKSGGAIYVDGVYAIISNSHIGLTNATTAGGAIYIEGIRASVINSTFEQTVAKATLSSYATDNKGGAIYIKGNFANVLGSEFDTAEAYVGGTIYLEGNYCNVTNSSVSNSYAYTDGGAVYSTGSNSNVYYSNFTNNSAEYDGGALYWFGGDSSTKNTVVGCIFTENIAYGGGSQTTKGGGAIYWSEGGSYSTMRDSKFIRNGVISKTKADGGAILLDNNKHCIIDNCTFDGDYVTGGSVDWVQGGAIFFRSNYVVVNECLFMDCWSQKEAGAIYLCNDKITPGVNDFIVANTTFINNTARTEDSYSTRSLGGGAVQLKQCSQVTFDNVTFINNTANKGGAFSINSVRGTTNYFYNCKFIGNEATDIGGAIWAANVLNIENATISGGSAGNYGGGIYATDTINYKNLTFINNSAERAGALYLTKPSQTLQNIAFINNTAILDGGALYIDKAFTIKNNNFTGNSAQNGGAIYVGVSNLALSSNNYTNNSAVLGGAIYTAEGITGGSVTSSHFTGNHAEYGGAIYAGSLGASNKIINIKDCTFVKNVAIFDGGAIYLLKSYYDITKCNFDGNNASNGGSIYAAESLNGINVKQSTFENSHAYGDGGAIYNSGSSLTFIIDNSEFRRNTADYNGGAVLYVTNDWKYRDYNNFDGIGTPASGGRTDVRSVDSSTTHFIKTSLFEDNHDYEFLVETISEIETPTITVQMTRPDNRDGRSIKYVVNITDGTYLEQIIVDPNNYTQGHYDPYKNVVYVTFNGLRINQTYNISVGFNDARYMYKEVNKTEQAHGEKIGEFTLLQRTIEKAIKEQRNLPVIEVNLTRSYTFTPDYFGEPLDTQCMNITVNLKQPIIIRAIGSVVLDADQFSRIFNITTSDVTFIGIQFIGGNANGTCGDGVDKGGAIFWAGDKGKVLNCSFIYNRAYIGGGLYLNESAENYKIDGCTFSENDADTYGGAIDCNAPEMELLNTVFERNTADTGAALCREITATGGHGDYNNFTKNHARTNGSALAWINASSININHYIFIDNTAGYSGGAIYVGQGSGNCVVNNSYFRGNNITGDIGHGGAIEWYAANGTVLNSTFINNHAHDGGALYVGFGSDNINVTESSFSNNSAVTKGGAISIEASKVIINASEFYDNNATEGGALYVGGENNINYVYSSIFHRNYANGGNGGAINWVASSGTIIGSDLSDNCAYYGGGIYFGGYAAESTIDNCNFTGNHARYKGGAIDCNSSAMFLSNTKFDANYAQFGSALCREISAKGGHGENNTFINNHAYVSGAALGWMESVNITIINYTFINNSADVSGGAIYVGPDSHNCSVINCYFDSNYVTNETRDTTEFSWTSWDGKPMRFEVRIAPSEDLINQTVIDEHITIYYRHYSADAYDTLGIGGAVCVLAWNATFVNSGFDRNYARLGGALYMGSNGGNTIINGSSFKSNRAYLRGGAVNLHASAVHIDDSEFKDNIAINGSALYVGGVGTNNKVHTSTFQGNNATGYGAGIYWVAYEGEIKDSKFINNAAEYGGGIYLNGRSSNTNITNTTFTRNNATKNGGAIECNAENIGIYNLTFEYNYAGAYGAALCREEGARYGHGDHNVFNYNHADIAGAALAWMGVKNIHIDYYNFIGNTADQRGGAIYVGNNSDFCIVEHCIFIGNNVTNDTLGIGGAIYINADNATIIHSIFTDNHATVAGAIAAGEESGFTKINNVTFTGNGAVLDGGAVNLRASGVAMNDTRFYSNTAGRHGGAVCVGGTGDNNTIYYSVFEYNKAGDHGGAIDWIANAGDIFYSNFTGNEAVYGGGIYLNGISSQSRIFNVVFDSNRATKNGGAIDCNASRMGLNNTLFISNYAGEYGAALCREANATKGFGGNNTFISNDAGIAGAALAWLGVRGININDYKFINNTAFTSGGAIYVREDSPDCKVRNSYFENNYVTDVRNGQGGAIGWLGPNGYINNTVFADSFAVNGGTIYAGELSDNLTILNSLFNSSRALTEGGSIYLASDNALINNTLFLYSFAVEYGGSISAHGANNVTMNNITVGYSVAAGHVDSSNKAFGEGGAIYWENGNNLFIFNSMFNDIEAHGFGGAISVINSNNSELNNVTFKGTLTIRNGGVISWIDSNNVTFDSSRFTDASASYYGGALYLNNMNDTTVKNSKFNNTSSPWGDGGAIYIDGNVTVDNNTFEQFTASNDNGYGIYVHNGTATISNSSFNGFDTIWIYKHATAYVINNTITGPEPNKQIKYLDQKYDTRYNPVDYSVWNDGTLYLDKNNFDYVIFNNGTIKSKTYTYILDNTTVNATWGQNFTFWASIKDDNNNSIISVKTLNTTNDVYPYPEYDMYLMPYNARMLNVSFQGIFHIDGVDSGLEDNTVFKGTLYVRVPTSVSINVTQYNEGEKVIIKAIMVKNNVEFTQNITIRVGDKDYSVKLIDGIATLELYNLSANTYSVTATYPGDINHFACENSTYFIVGLRDTWMKLIIENVVYGQYTVINLTTNANGTVEFSMNGRRERMNITNGQILFTLPSILPPATYSMGVVYLGNEYYKYAINSTSFEVYKLNTTINATPTNITVGENEIINVNVDKLATGYVAITIGREIYVAPISKGTAQFNITNLPAGLYKDIVIQYNGNNYVNNNTTKVTFKIDPKYDYDFTVSADNITYGQNATIRVFLPTSARGNATIYVDGIFRGKVEFRDGLARLDNIAGLGSGAHEVNVTYDGDGTYGPRDNNGTIFYVNPTPDWNIELTADVHKYHDNTTFYVKLPSDVVKNVTIKVEGVNYTVELVNGEGNLTLNNISSEVHDIVAYYAGDDKYAPKSASLWVFVDRTTPSIYINVDPIYVGQTATINITTTGEANGNVTVYICGQEITRTLVNHTTQINVTGLPYGTHTLLVFYHRDQNYTRHVETAELVVSKYPTSINITVGDKYYVDESFNITVQNTTKVTVTINGKAYTITNGNITINAKELAAGHYVITATTYEDEKYLGNVTVKEFDIIKRAGEVDITISGNNPHAVGEAFTITVTNNTEVTVTVNGKTYRINSTTGILNISTAELPIGEYIVTATIAESDVYLANTTTKTFNIARNASGIVSVVATPEVVVGKNTTVTVTMANVTEGKVMIEVNGYNYTVEINDGVAELNVTLPVGDYNVKACYLGDGEHTPANATGNAFSVIDKITPEITIVPPSATKVGDVVNITVSSNGYNFTVWINGVKQTIVNENIAYTVPFEGIHTIYASTTENETYYSANKTVIFGAVKNNATLIISEISVVYVGDKVTITVTNVTDGALTIKVNGVSIENGEIFTPNIEGNYTITVESAETVMYNAGYNSTVFTVNKRSSHVNVKASGNTVGADATITVQVESNATGYVTLDVNGTNYTIKLNSIGAGSVDIAGLGNGTYYVHATYLGDNQYALSTNITETFEMTKLNVEMDILVQDITYGHDANITVTVTSGATGYITIRINETRSITLPIVEGKVRWIVPDLAAGNYTVYANYSGDAKYNINNTASVNRSFEVKKANPGLEIVSFTCVVYENGRIEISINPETAGEKLNITVGTDKYTDIIIPADGKLTFVTTNAINEYNSYDVTVEYAGNENFTADEFKYSYSTTKITTYGLKVNGMNITVGDDEIITVEVPNHVDDVVIWVNGESFRNASFSGNKATFNITHLNLKQGIYTVTATVNDTEFEHKNFTSIFTVNKTSVPMNITIFNNASIYVGDTVKVVVSLPKDVTENVTIEINNIKLTNVTVNGNTTFYVPSITYGNKTVVAAYVGDDKYYYNSTTANFTVNKRNSQVNVTAEGNAVGGNATITVQVQSNAAGYVTVNVNGTNYNIKLNSTGAGSINITGLGNGTYYVHATYIGDDQYLPNVNNTVTFEMDKVVPVINIDVDNVTYGTETVIVVTVSGATGNVTIKIDDTNKGEFTLVNGKVTLNAGILGVENYTVHVSYKGDDKYSTGSADKKFNVTKATPGIVIEGVTVDANTNATVRVTINVDASGSLNITVNNKNFTANIIGGVVVFTVDKLPVGKYDIVANYTGDDNYTARFKDTLKDGLTVIKVQDYEMNVTAIDGHVGENTTITIHVPKDATGNVTVWVNGTKLTNSTIVNGVATLTLNKTVAGKYVVNATLSDDKYANQTVFTSYWVSKVETPITITVNNKDDIKVGDTVTITVDLPDDIVGEKVTIETNGKSYEQVTGVDGIATFTVPSVTYGNKTVAAIYVGNNKYVYNATTANFTVSKRASQVDVTGDVIVVGENATVTVNVTSGATGYVVVSVNGQNYTINLTQSRGSVNIVGLKNATYPITATYLGDDKYLGNVSQTVNVTVNKLTISIFVTDMNNEDDDVNLTPIISGDDKIIVVQLNPQINGFVTLIVEEVGNNNPKSYEVAIVNGRGQYVVSNLYNATYNIKAVFEGDDKYEAQNSTVKQLMVNKIITNLAITIDKNIIFVGDKAVVSIILDQSINAVVTVKVNGANHTVGIVNGKGDFTLANLTEGNYTINAVFAGDDRYVSSTSNTVKCNVIKIPTGLTVNATNAIVVGNDAVINITLNETIDANVVLRVNGKEYNVAIIGGLGNFTVANLPVGTYYINATYTGSDKYIASTSQTVEMNVSKADWEARIIAQNATVEENPSFIITAPIDFDGNVSIKVGGVEYYDDIFKTLTEISKFEADNYTANVTFYGDSKYANRTYLVNFTVFRINSIIAITIDDTTYPINAVAQITVSNNANGTVQILLGDKVIGSGTVTKGQATINLDQLSASAKEVTVKFTSTDSYNNNITTTAKFVVNKAASSVEIIRNSTDVIAVVTPAESGNVVFYINGVKYENVTVNGNATIKDVLVIGNNTVSVVYKGNENYTESNDGDILEIVKITTDLTVEATPSVIIGKNTTITVTMVNVTTGRVMIEVNGYNYTVNINQGIAKLNVTLPVGEYTAKAYYLGDLEHVSSNKTSATFRVIDKLTPEINIVVPSVVKVGETINITVSTDGDNLTVWINGVKQTIVGDNISYTVTTAGINNIVATTTENETVYAATNTTVFEAFKNNATLIISEITVVKVGDEVTIIVNNVTDGSLTIKLNGNTITNGTKFTPAASGNYTITVESDETGKYYAGFNETTFVVIKHNSTAEITVDPTYYVGEGFEITVTSNTTVNVTINGRNYTVTAGKVTIPAGEFKAGNYTVTATVYESDKYNGFVTSKDFKVIKHESEVAIATSSIKVGEVAVINIIASNYNGSAIVNINNNNYSVAITGGKGQLKVADLRNGTYDITVTYLENDRYMSNNNATTLVVSKVDSFLDVTVTTPISSGDEIITFALPADATGNITVIVNKVTYSVAVSGGKGTLTIQGLHKGDYVVNATYNGDNKYSKYVNTTQVFKVIQHSTDMVVVDERNRTVIIHLQDNATGKVFVDVDGKVYNATVANGTAVVTLTDAAPGTHTAHISYVSDNADFNDTEAIAEVHIPKYATPISANVSVFKVGDVGYINVTLPNGTTGMVIIEVNGKAYNTTDIVNGVARFEIGDLTYGNKTFIIEYSGDDNYLANDTASTLEVLKHDSSITVAVDNIDVGGVAQINITGPSDISGVVVVNVGGVDYNVILNEGKGSVKVANLANGTYDIAATYLENTKYLSSVNDTAKVTVSKVTPEIKASVENITDDKNAAFEITLPEDATGTVTIKVNDTTSITVGVTGGVNKVLVENLKAGKYDVNITYSGNDKYNPVNANVALNVTKAKPSVVEGVQVIDQGNGTVKIVVPDNSTGNVTIKVGNETYNATVVNGTAIIDFNNVTPGNNNITVKYVGEDGQTVEFNSTVNIPKYATPITIEVAGGVVGTPVEITVKVDGNITKEITIEVDGKNYTKAVDNGKAVFTVDLTAGDKTVTATYAGDDKYLFNSTTEQFKVSRLPSPMSVSASVSGNTATITVSGLPSDATGYVIVKVNGVEYGINITSTKEVKVPLTHTGNYDVVASYLGDDKYMANASSTSFHATIGDENITIDLSNTTVGSDLVIKVDVPQDADGNITVTVDNQTITQKVVPGENVITLSGLSEGAHDLNVTYSGDSKYDSKTVVQTIYVSSTINAHDKQTRGWDSAYDFSAEFLDKDGHVLKDTDVQIQVNGKTYTVRTDNEGIAYLTDSNLPVGTYDVVCLNPVTGQNVTYKLTIVKRILENKDMTMDFASGKSFKVKVIGDDGNPAPAGEYVAITVNGIKYAAVTDANGYASLKINLNPGKYTVTAEYKNTKTTNKVTVKQTLKLVKKTVSVKKGKKLILKAKFKWSNGKAIKGKVIKFKFKGKTYKAKTNKKGIAKVTVKAKVTKKLKKGKKITYTATYLSNTVKGKVKVK